MCPGQLGTTHQCGADDGYRLQWFVRRYKEKTFKRYCTGAYAPAQQSRVV